MDDSIVVVDYNSNWPILYEEEKQHLLDAIGSDVLDIQHIGRRKKEEGRRKKEEG